VALDQRTSQGRLPRAVWSHNDDERCRVCHAAAGIDMPSSYRRRLRRPPLQARAAGSMNA
jgi:hypothetical protein